MQDADVKPQEAPAPSPQAAQPATDGALADQKRTKMAWLMVGAAAAALIASFLPWASSSGGEGLGGFSWGPGKVTAVMAILLGLYGLQGLRKDDPNVRHHGWAIAALVIGLLTAVFSQTILDNIDSLTLGAGDISAGTGLILTFLTFLFAIWPLVVLRKDARSRGDSAVIASGAPAVRTPAPFKGTAEQTPSQYNAGWYTDPMSRHERRYYDGSAWTEHVVDGPAQSTDVL